MIIKMLFLINLTLLGISIINISNYIMKLEDTIKVLKSKNELNERVIDLMADNLVTQYHDKFWVIRYYIEEAERKNEKIKKKKE